MVSYVIKFKILSLKNVFAYFSKQIKHLDMSIGGYIITFTLFKVYNLIFLSEKKSFTVTV